MNYHPHFQQINYMEDPQMAKLKQDNIQLQDPRRVKLKQDSIQLQDPRMAKLKQDNIELQKALQQLNECYQEKVSLLEEELKRSKQREQALLQWKSSYIDKELFNNSKYHEQLQKMILIIQQLAGNYQKQTQNFTKQLQQKQHLLEDFSKQLQHKQNLLDQLKNQNLILKEQKLHQQKEIQSLVQKYIVEIESLKTQLKELKDEITYQSNQQQERDFSIHHQLGNWQSDTGSYNGDDAGSYNGDDSQVGINYGDERDLPKSHEVQGQNLAILKDISNQQLQPIKDVEKQKNTQSHQITLLKGQLVC